MSRAVGTTVLDIHAMYLRAIIETGVARGLNRAQLVSASGLSANQIDSADARVPITASYALWEFAVRTLRDPAFPIDYARQLRIEHGPLGFAVMTAPSGHAALQHLLRYCAIATTSGHWSMEERADEAWVRWRRPGEPTLGQRIANEAAVAEFLSGVRQVLGMEVRPTAVHFRHAAPPTLREHETFFGVPVRFGQPDHAIGLPLSVLQKPPRLANEALASYFEARSIAEMQRARREQSLVERAESLTADQLLDGPPSSARLARQLGLAERTLRRKLGEAGTSHSAIVDAVRRERAEAMLRDPALTLADIAFALGFSAHAAFTRAYKRWTGRSPDSTRRLARDPAVPGG